MQNKSAIWAFTILLTIACIYQLSFTFVAGRVESKANEVAIQKLDSLINTGVELDNTAKDSALISFTDNYLFEQNNEVVYPIFNYKYKKVKKNELNLGLDLQGGMNVTLEVSLVDLIKVLSGNSDDPTLNKAIEMAIEKQKSSQDDFVTLFAKSITEIDAQYKLAAIFHNRENKEKFPREATNDEIIEIIQEEAAEAVKRTEQVLRKRIDNLGVVQPKIQRLSGSDRIIVELPGIRDKRRVRKILQGTAKLEFWETYDNAQVFNSLDQINELLKKTTKTEDTSKVADAPKADALDDLFAEDADSGIDTLSSDSSASTDDILSELSGDSDTSSVDGTESFEDFKKENPLFGLLRPALTQDPSSGQFFPMKGAVVGFANVKDVEKVNAYLALPEVQKLLPPRIQFYWGAKPYDENEEFLQLFAIRITSRDGKAPLEGDVITNARVENDPMGNPEVALSMNATGAQTWRRLTKENVGKSIAIVLDGFVYSAPNVMSEISGGRSSISGGFTQEESNDLANVLKAGKLPAPANIIEEAVVGPSLGAEAISSGLSSFLIALVLVLLYMAFYYARAGVIADIALVANIFFVMGVLASLGATLTLPGIAGIVLTIGMSVDANVLIYERIREELTAGKGIKLAIKDGYNAAYSSIIDANITTLLTGIILSTFGTGPIKGFATTLIIGILTSLFCAIFITRLLIEWRLEKGGVMNFASKATQNAFQNLNFQFVHKRRLFYTISGVIILMGVVSFLTRGLNYGVDFTGGRSYIVRFDEKVAVEDVASKLSAYFISENGVAETPEVKTYGASNQVKITTKYLIDVSGEEIEEMVESKLNEGLISVGMGYELMSSQKVEATIADDIKTSAYWAVIFSLLVIFLYILLRFKGWQFGVGALVAMFHDVVIVLAVFSIFNGFLPFSLEIDQAFIAAILTVVGYSINDTVVVFDRIREYLGLHKRKSSEEVINTALNSTLSRTINTSLSTFLVLLMIFVFGGEVIRGFVFALMIGVIVGTYSSLCVATPIMIDMTNFKKKA